MGGPLSDIHTINAIEEDQQGHVWLVTGDQGLLEYDGKNIKKGADGVTYVPRSPAGRVGSNYGKLCDEASRQEEMQAAAQASQNEEVARAKENFCEGVISAIPDGSLQVSVRVVEEKED